MAMKQIPVTFHVRAEPRPELLAARRHRVRPYRVIVQGVSIFVVMGVSFGYVMSVMVSPKKTTIAAAAPPAVPTSVAAGAPLSFDVWQRPAPTREFTAPSQLPAPTAMTTAFDPPELSDRTPVASIPASRARAPGAFAPMERSPDYTGFKVTAGH